MIRTSCYLTVFICGLGCCTYGADSPEHSIVHARDFDVQPELAALPGQYVLLDHMNPDFPAIAIRYRLASGSHQFCLQTNDPYYSGLVVENAVGEEVLRNGNAVGCAQADVPEGVYTLSVLHAAQSGADPRRITYLQVDPNGPDLQINGKWLPGWWAINALGAVNEFPPTLRLQLPFRALDAGENKHAAPLFFDHVSHAVDEYSLFHIVFPPDNTPVIFAGLTDGEPYNFSAVSGSIPGDDVGVTLTVNTLGERQIPVIPMDLGHYSFALLRSCIAADIYSKTALVYDYQFPKPCQVTLYVQFRFLTDGTQIAGLQAGEVALYQETGFKGKAAVFPFTLSPLNLIDSPAITINNTAKSVRVSPGTAIVWATPSGEPTSLVSDTDNLSGEREVPAGPDFAVLPLPLLFYVNEPAQTLNYKCIGCYLHGQDVEGIGPGYPLNLAGGIDFSKSDFTQATLVDVDFSGANLTGVDFSGATLTNVKFTNATLTGTKFAGATLSCIDFSGETNAPLTDLTQADFTDVKWVGTPNCSINLSRAKFTAAFPLADWKYANLKNAVFAGPVGTVLSSEDNPADLTGASLAYLTIQNVVLDYATGLAGTDLTRIDVSHSSLRHVNLSTAKLYGATLDHANLEGSNLNGAVLTSFSTAGIPAATLQGTFMRNVNFSQAQLSGADFQDASLYSTNAVGTGTCAPDPVSGFTTGCATVAAAVMNDTFFSSTYLFGVDFTNSSAQGVQFGGAILAGSNFSGATLSAQSDGLNTNFSNAFLQGTVFAGAQLQNQPSFADAFVDFRPDGNIIALQLNGKHTDFPGYWKTPGQAVCAYMTYSNPTIPPQTGPPVTCPDGNSYEGGCGPPSPDGNNSRWESPKDITPLASYQYNATYTDAPASGTPICAIDINWLGFAFKLDKPAAH